MGKWDARWTRRVASDCALDVDISEPFVLKSPQELKTAHPMWSPGGREYLGPPLYATDLSVALGISLCP